MWTGNSVGGDTDKWMCRGSRGKVTPDPWTLAATGAITDADVPRSWTERGQSEAAPTACSRMAEAEASLRLRTTRCRDCGRGQSATADCSRSEHLRDCALTVADVSSRKGRCCGRNALLLRGCAVTDPRLIRGRRILVTTRGKACPVLIMMRNALPLVLAEFAAPLLQLRGHGLNAVDLLDAYHLGPRSYVSAESCLWQFNDEIRGVAVEMFAKPFQHLDGDSDLSGCRCVHNQMWIPREGVRARLGRRLCRGLDNHSAPLTSSGRTGCAQGALNPSRAAASSAASLVGASTTVRNGSPISRAYSRSVW